MNKIKVLNIFSDKNKEQILKLALKNRAPLQYVWPCYSGGAKLCGVCESCVRFANALKKAEATALCTEYKTYYNLKH